MISPLDETCPPETVVKDETRAMPVVSTEAGSIISVAAEGVAQGLTVTPVQQDEDCPGARTGDGCE